MSLEVRKVPGMGRGVFALKNFKKGAIIEVCHVILLPIPEGSKKNPTQNYSFRWNEDSVAIALGNGSLYNHSYEPNAKVFENVRALTMTFAAHKDIKKGEEIFINYNGEPEIQKPLWFDTKKPKVQKVQAAAKKAVAKTFKKLPSAYTKAAAQAKPKTLKEKKYDALEKFSAEANNAPRSTVSKTKVAAAKKVAAKKSAAKPKAPTVH